MAPANVPSLTYWKSLTYFSSYRLIIAMLLIASVYVGKWGFDLGAPSEGGALFANVAWFYLLACATSVALVLRWRQHFNSQVGLQVAIDTVVFILLLHAAGGMQSGIGILLLVSLAGAGLVGQGRLVLLYAALATIALLSHQVYQSLATEFYGAKFVQAGAMSLAFFAVAIMARLLASRVLASEDLARQRGEDLQRQLKLTTRVIAMLDDGILVVSSIGQVFQANPRARELLGLHGELGNLAAIQPGLAEAFMAWRAFADPETVEFRGGVLRTLLSARFIDVPDAGGDAIIIVQDVGEQREFSQRQKLAALGRLTGGIAHEIRNPLSSIQYAAELLKEDNRSGSGSRMLDIVLDNAQRIEHIVSDVLELGRRDRASPQSIRLESFLASFAAEFEATSGWLPGRLAIETAPAAEMRFDASHLRQVLWNLATNAGRYASHKVGSVKVTAELNPVHIAVEDDGPGVPASAVSQLFEPFYTTHAQGNGLGLYIARELCEANGGRLHYERGARGARFVIYGDV